MSLSAEYSLWWIPFCLLLGVGYATLLYWRTSRPSMSSNTRVMLALCRTLSVALIAFLLLNPLFNKSKKELEKPIIVLGIDNSQSLLITSRSAYYQGEFLSKLNQLIRDLKKDFQVDTYLFGETTRKGNIPNFNDVNTNIADFINNIKTAYYQRNLGAVLMFSDGIVNTGTSYLGIAQGLQVPFYTMIMGDTIIQKDVFIAKTNYNKTVYLNNIFPIEILVRAEQLNGKTSVLDVYENDKKVHSQTIAINSNNFSQWIKLAFEAKSAGILHYRIELSPVDEEITNINNKKSIAIEVLDKRKKIALIYHSPNPDIAAISAALQTSNAYQVEAFSVNQFSTKIENYDMLVLHQIPTEDNEVQLLETALQSQIPTLFILGKSTNFVLWNKFNLGMKVSIRKNMQNDAFPLLNNNYSGISLSPLTTDLLHLLPPIETPFGKYNLSPETNVLLYQKIGNVETDYPLLLFTQGQNGRMAVFIGEGLWRWRMHNYLHSATHDQFDELILKIFQYVGTKEDKSFFRVSGKTIYAEHETISFDAELYNASYELVNTPEVMMTIKGVDNTHQFAFSRVGKAYHLDVSSLPKGNYQWTASTMLDNEKYSKSGYFSVQEINLESVNLTADFQSMVNLATQNNGRYFNDTDFDAMYKSICENKMIKSVAHYYKTHQLLSDKWFLLILIVVFLGFEWFVRKWCGDY